MKMYRSTTQSLAVAILCAVLIGQASGQDSAVPLDRDYQVQGEYLGRLNVDGSGKQPYGMQVVAIGNGKFKANLLPGGLPGEGWDGETRIPFSGGREGRDVHLTSENSGWEAWLFNPGGGRWYVSDPQGKRQLGSLASVDRYSPTLGNKPPEGAKVLFAGEMTELLQGAELDEDGLLKQGFETKEPVKDFFLHVEFRTPWEPELNSQSRGNSGVYIQKRYELQILDSFGLNELINGCGAIYQQTPPDQNMALPPLRWQTYDIRFKAARWNEAGEKTANAQISVWHNGIPIHSDREITSKTGAGQQEAPNAMKILFQDHTNQVRFRNIWLIPGG